MRSFLPTLLAALLLATPARAETPACAGTDLIAELAEAAPERLAAIRAEAEKIPNGKGVFFEVEKPGVAPSFLFGTVHVTDPRVTELPEAVSEAVASADIVLVESVEAVEGDAAKVLGPTLAEIGVFTDGRTLDDLITRDEKRVVAAAAGRLGLPYFAVRPLKPWVVAVMLALPACETARVRAKLPVVDGIVIERARAAGVPVESLETIADQLGVMAAMPEKLQAEFLLETARIAEQVEDGLETMLRLYLDRDIATIIPFFQDLARAASGDASSASWAFIQRELLDKRNRKMIERALPHLDEGRVVIAVGALHLSGEEGLIELLRRAGFSVTRLD